MLTIRTPHVTQHPSIFRKYHRNTESYYSKLIGCRLMFLILNVYLFSWRYNPLCLYFHSPVAGFSLLIFEVS